MTTVTASIVSTGEADKLVSCLQALARQRFDGALRVVVVCNGCDDGSDRVTRELIPAAHVIVRSDKGGFAENHNAALRAVPSAFGLVLNPDVVLADDCIAELLAAMHRHPHAGLVGPLMRFPDGRSQPSARRFPRLMGTLVRRTPLRRFAEDRVLASAHYLPPPTEDREVDWILGAVLFARTEAWAAIGGFDPGFRPLYVEDIDVAWRMWSAGWAVWQAPSAVAVHEHQAVTDRTFLDRRTMWHAKGMLRFVRKHPTILINSRRPVAPGAAAQGNRSSDSA